MSEYTTDHPKTAAVLQQQQEFHRKESIDASRLTKREKFAMAALQGLLANPAFAAEFGSSAYVGTPASAAVYHADDLIAELNKEAKS